MPDVEGVCQGLAFHQAVHGMQEMLPEHLPDNVKMHNQA